MRLSILIMVPLLVAINACSDDNGVRPAETGIEPVVAFPKLSFSRPVDLQHPGDGSDRLFVVEQEGRVIVFENTADVESTAIFLDIRSRVNAGGEEGLLGLAFHPDYGTNGYFYLYYSVANPRRSRLSRFEVDPQDPQTGLPGSEVVILEIGQPYANHNGGQIAFGPDGYLYIAVGDGGSAGDPQGNGQSPATLLGSILRIDVDGSPYGIPPDNPFVGNALGYREEIFAFGFRNPWRLSFDPVTGWLWAGDVGQNRYEEIDLVEKGENYGWNTMEGTHCYPDPPCDADGLALPVWEYPHPLGRSVTGGYVYRGSRVPDLVGAYVYGDYVTGLIWALRYDGQNTPVNDVIADTALNIASFGVDQHSELYICAFDGKIYTLQELQTKK